MTEKGFHQIVLEHLEKEVEVITLQGNYSGRLTHAGKDVIVIHSRGRGFPMNLAIRIDTIVGIYRMEFAPRDPFGFNPGIAELEREEKESNSNSR